MAYDDNDEPSARCHTNGGLRIVDGISTGLSTIGLVYSTYLLFNSKTSTNTKMYSEQMIFETDYDFMTASDELRKQTIHACSANPLQDDYRMYFNDQEWGNVVYRGIPLPIESVFSFDPWYLLQWVLTTSVLFQCARTTFPNYRPEDGPDAWRWVEYALTSPLQIVIICSSFYMRELYFLFLIAGLQGALVTMGYGIELQIQLVCDTQLEHSRKQTTCTTCTVILDVVKLYLSFFAASIFHIIIWGVILCKFFAQDHAFTDCQDSSGMPWFVRFIVIFECCLFTAFGLVMFVQILHFTTTSHQKTQQQHMSMWWYVALA